MILIFCIVLSVLYYDYLHTKKLINLIYIHIVMNLYTIKNLCTGDGAVWGLLDKKDLTNYVDITTKKLSLDLNNKKVLDLGCGDGVMLKHLHDKYSIDPHGVDLSNLNISICKKKMPLNKNNFHCQDIIKYLESCDDDSFDFIISYGVIVYVTDENKKIIINHISRILKNNCYCWLGGNMKWALYPIKDEFWNDIDNDNLSLTHFCETEVFNNTAYKSKSTIIHKINKN